MCVSKVPLFEVTIPVPQHMIKKNSRPIFRNGKKVFIGKTKELQQMEQYLLMKLLVSKVELRVKKITEDVNLKVVFLEPNYWLKNGEKRRRKNIGDLSNLYQIIEDALQDSGVIENDCQIQGHDGSRIRPSSNRAVNICLTSLDALES
jgi:Holliday junction resolvase RusA-like endonuclease